MEADPNEQAPAMPPAFDRNLLIVHLGAYASVTPAMAKAASELALQGGVFDIVPRKNKIEAAVERPEGWEDDVVLRLKTGQAVSNCFCGRRRCKHALAVLLVLLETMRRARPQEAPELQTQLPNAWLDVRGSLKISRIFSEAISYWMLKGGDPKDYLPVPFQLANRIPFNVKPGPGEAPAEAPAEPSKASAKRTGKSKSTTTIVAPAAPVAPWWQIFMDPAASDETRRNLLEIEIRRRTNGGKIWVVPDAAAGLVRLGDPALALTELGAQIRRIAASYHLRELPPEEPEFTAYLASPEFAEARRGYEVARHQETILKWLAAQDRKLTSEIPDAFVESRLWLSRSGEALPTLQTEILLTTAKLRRSPRTPSSVASFARDVESGNRRVPAEQRALAVWLGSVAHSMPTAASTNTLLGVFDAMEWFSMWGGTGGLVWEDESPVGYEPRPGWLETRAEAGHPPELCVRPSAGSPPIPLREAQLFIEAREYSVYGSRIRDPRLFARVGSAIVRIESGDIPFSVVEAAVNLPELPLERIKQKGLADAFLASMVLSDGGVGLKRANAPVNEIAGPFIRELPARVRVELRLGEDNLFSLHARADTEEGPAFSCLSPGDWVLLESIAPGPGANDSAAAEASDSKFAIEAIPAEPGAEPAPEPSAEPEPPKPHALKEQPRRSDVEPVEEWIDQFIPARVTLEPGAEGEPRLTWKAAPDAVAAILRAWPSRPSGAKYLGDKAFQRLIAPMKAPSFSADFIPAGVNWFEIDLRWEDEIKDISADDLLKSLRDSDGELVLLPGGRVFRRDELEKFEKKLEFISSLGLDPRGKSQRLHATQLIGADDGALADLNGAGDDMRALLEKAREAVRGFQGIPAADIEPVIEPILRPYQRHGADFMVWAGETFGGALLADEMGLGKTLQTLAALSAMRRKAGADAPPSLVICPASVAHNWERESARFLPGLRTVIIASGSGRRATLARLTDYDMVITNYALARIDESALAKQNWLMVCVDEAQAIKNPRSEIARVVRRLPAQSRFALTGTPVENRLSDIASIIEFALPGYLAPLGGMDAFAGNEAGSSLRRALRARLRPIFLRRLKTEVAPELPDRIEERIDCEMGAAQKRLYLTEVKRAREIVAGSKNDAVTGASRIQVLAALTRLRQICCDPALVGATSTESIKVRTLLELLGPILESGHKILVFSQFVRMLDIIRPELRKNEIKTHYLTGKTKDRKTVVDNFEGDPDPCVFLISLKAGGSGLNLTAASHVVIFDPWWNPAVEAQAIDRAHRIGQDKTVIAMRLVTTGTIEERILKLQEMKKDLIRSVVEDESFNRMLSREDFEFLLSADDAVGALEEI